MAGNVFEWTQDQANISGEGDFRVLKGGAWYHHDVRVLASSYEGAWNVGGDPNGVTGLRCVRSCLSGE
jgi:formylglycine-generating enzyme required for sulfatase activity